MLSKQTLIMLSKFQVGTGQLSAMESQVANPYLHIRGGIHHYPETGLNPD